jgi:hypothetical protein
MITAPVFDTKPYDRELLQRASTAGQSFVEGSVLT